MLMRMIEVYLVGGPIAVSVAVPLLLGGLLLRRRRPAL